MFDRHVMSRSWLPPLLWSTGCQTKSVMTSHSWNGLSCQTPDSVGFWWIAYVSFFAPLAYHKRWQFGIGIVIGGYAGYAFNFMVTCLFWIWRLFCILFCLTVINKLSCRLLKYFGYGWKRQRRCQLGNGWWGQKWPWWRWWCKKVSGKFVNINGNEFSALY